MLFSYKPNLFNGPYPNQKQHLSGVHNVKLTNDICELVYIHTEHVSLHLPKK